MCRVSAGIWHHGAFLIQTTYSREPELVKGGTLHRQMGVGRSGQEPGWVAWARESVGLEAKPNRAHRKEGG